MLIVKKLPNSMSAESYNSLRTRLMYSSVDNPLKTIVMTSAVANEGKSSVASNLAISLSNLEKRVLVIDCDLRKPTLHEKFEVSNEFGLTDILTKRCRYDKAVQEITDSLHLISSGPLPANPSDMVGSRSLKQFIESVEAIYDYIILDTPPVLAVTDAQLLAAHADGTVLVVRANRTRTKLIGQAYKELQKVNANLIGSVLNGRERIREDSYKIYYKKILNKKKARK